MKLNLPDYVCCICGKEFTGWGNNPYPVVNNSYSRCCDECNATKVVPARLAQLLNKKEK